MDYLVYKLDTGKSLDIETYQNELVCYLESPYHSPLFWPLNADMSIDGNHRKNIDNINQREI